MGKLRQLVYVSSAVRLLREAELLEVLEQSRVKNAASDLTGMLLYAEGSFIQVLEGGALAVEKLLRKIRRDLRHKGFLILLDRTIEERDFEGRAMGFKRLEQQELDVLAGFHEWSSDMPTRRRTAGAVRLIETFRQISDRH